MKTALKKMFAILAEKEGDDSKLISLLEKIGIKKDSIEKVNKGDLSIEDAVSDIEKTFEKSVEERIKADVIKTSKSEIHKGVYEKVQNMICKQFGIDYSKYATVEEKERIETILKDAKKAQEDKFVEMEGKFTSADAGKLKELEIKYQSQLDAANKEKLEAFSAKEKAELEANSKVANIKKDIAYQKLQDEFFNGIKNPALSKKQMENIVKGLMNGVQFEVDETDLANPRTFILDQNNARVKSKKTSSQNMTLQEKLEEIAVENEFEKKSNAGSGSGFIANTELGNEDLKGIHPDALKEMQKRGLLP